MMDLKLAEALDKAGTLPSLDNGWEKLGFLRNPFPTRASPKWDVFHNQAAVRDRFQTDLVEFLKTGSTTTLFFTGGNRVGKTHFMEYYRRALPSQLGSRGVVLPIVVASAETASLEQFYFHLVDQVVASVHSQTGVALFNLPEVAPDRLRPGDLRRALTTIRNATDQAKPALRTLLAGWVCGQRLRQTQRNELGVFGLVDSPSQIQNTFGGLVRYLRGCNFGNAGAGSPRCPGILVFVDEFELVWSQRRDRRDQFLQGVRALVDECAEGGLFLCVGMATGLDPEVATLEGDYPALFARLKGAREVPALVEIENGVMGGEYARAFEEFERQEYLRARPSSDKAPQPGLFSEREIESFFSDLTGSAPGASVTQADFFDKLHEEAERKLPVTPG